MKLDDLLLWWAEWSAKREDGGLGFGVSRFNRLMAAGNLLPRSDVMTQLPYGVDGDSVAVVVDRAVCGLTPKRREAIKVEYMRIGTQDAKAAGLGIGRAAYEKRLYWARANLAADKAVKKLLKGVDRDV